MSRFVLALDQGTTSSRAILFDHGGLIQAVAQQEFKQYFPQPGWVEHNGEEIWNSQLTVARQVLQKALLTAKDIVAIGITNQRETTLVWNRQTGKPIHPAIVWQDRRTASICDQLRQAGHTALIQQKTGLVVDAYFSGTKIQWLLDNVPDARKQAEAGELAFGTMDSWLIWNLTGGQRHVTDVTNASRTQLFNIDTLEWDDELLKLLKVPASLLPEVASSSEVYAETQTNLLGASVPIAGIAGDQQAALFGQLCTQPGMVKNTYGTGSFVVLNTGDQPIASQHNLLSTVAWQINGKTTYALEGSIFIAGAIVQWLRDGLGIIKESADVEALASTVDDNGGVYVVPALTGLGAPHWDPYAPRHHCRDHPGHHRGAHCPGRRGEHGLPNQRRTAGHAGRRPNHLSGAACGRRGFGQRPPDAVSGRRVAGAGGAAQNHGNHRAGSGLPGRTRRGLLEKTRKNSLSSGRWIVDLNRRTRRLPKA